ncbi:MAG: UvrB/UvrC motif-containing protein [Bryobacterales bacterium]|nr:UvrB/UvrC motif-containing protein [Bryobacterales bacterium]
MIDALPRAPAVFVLDLGEAKQPYLARTSNLWRRVRRLLRPVHGFSRMLYLRGIARELSYWHAPNGLASALLVWEQTRLHNPENYRHMLRLRLPYYVALLSEDRFPRAIVTRNPARDDAAFGPFFTRGEAEAFLAQSLDLFLLRRCEEELDPHPDHPGCIYGEMSMCLRPCQVAPAEAAYRGEAREFLSLLATRGASLQGRLEQERQTASEALDFESAARLHKRLTKLAACFPSSLGIARQLSALHGFAVAKGSQSTHAVVWPVWGGHLQPPRILDAANLEAEVLHQSLRMSEAEATVHPNEARQELLALLTKWLRSSWCDGEWVEMAEAGRVPTRRLRNAIRRMTVRPDARDEPTPREESEAGDDARHI